MAIFRGEEEIILQRSNGKNKRQLSEDDDYLKLGEIRIKDSKYYYKPNLREQINSSIFDKSENSSILESDNLSWLVYKGNKIPFYKKSYRLKEGDIIKLGREWLLIKDIHISSYTRRKINKNNNKQKTNDNNPGIFMTFHSQTNQSLNLNQDFNNFDEDNDTDEEKLYDNNDKENNVINVTENNINTKKLLNKDKEKEKDKDKENKNENNKELISSNESEEKNYEIDKKKENKKICRICYMEEMDKKNNPLIKPCKCSGSMKYIHYECLLHWLKTKIMISKNMYNNNGFFTIYSLDLIECELCKNHLPNYIKHKNKIFSLLDLDKKFEEEKEKKSKKNMELKGKGDLNIFNKKKKDINNYIIFDTVTPGKTENKYRYLVKFDKNNCMKIGRALEMQLILNDISVSRNHCQIRLEDDGNIILEDNNSKFGSLVLMQAESFEILKGQTLTIQVGTNYLNISLKQPTSLFGCCNAEEIDYKHSYEKINSKAIKFDKSNELLNESITPENSENEGEEENKNHNKIQNNGDKKELTNKEKENMKQDLKIWEKKMADNKNNKNNNNFDSTYIGSTLFVKENQNEEEKNNNNEATNLKLINIVNENDKLKEKNENIIASGKVIISESNDNEEKEKNNDNNNKNLMNDEN